MPPTDSISKSYTNVPAGKSSVTVSAINISIVPALPPKVIPADAEVKLCLLSNVLL